MLVSYIDCTGVIAWEVDNWLSSICQFELVLWPEAGNDCILCKSKFIAGRLASIVPLMLLPPAALELPLAVLLIIGVRLCPAQNFQAITHAIATA
jgi:hypothetical protein